MALNVEKDLSAVSSVATCNWDSIDHLPISSLAAFSVVAPEWNAYPWTWYPEQETEPFQPLSFTSASRCTEVFPCGLQENRVSRVISSLFSLSLSLISIFISLPPKNDCLISASLEFYNNGIIWYILASFSLPLYYFKDSFHIILTVEASPLFFSVFRR